MGSVQLGETTMSAAAYTNDARLHVWQGGWIGLVIS